MVPSSTQQAILREHRVGFAPWAIAQHFGVSLQDVSDIIHGLKRDATPKARPGRKRKLKPGQPPPLEELSSLALVAKGLIFSGSSARVVWGNFADAVHMDWCIHWETERDASNFKQGQ